jgi:hypothetical protein
VLRKAPIADERGRLQLRASVFDVVGAVRIALAAELTLYTLALVASLFVYSFLRPTIGRMGE